MLYILILCSNNPKTITRYLRDM